jgi:hypothetical protein
MPVPGDIESLAAGLRTLPVGGPLLKGMPSLVSHDDPELRKSQGISHAFGKDC